MIFKESEKSGMQWRRYMDATMRETHKSKRQQREGEGVSTENFRE